jgi:hypothetical protein
MSDAQDKMDQAMGRALRDEEFRNRLAAEPKETLKGVGLTDEDLESVAGGYGDNVSLNFSKIVVEYKEYKTGISQDFHFTKRFDKPSSIL